MAASRGRLNGFEVVESSSVTSDEVNQTFIAIGGSVVLKLFPSCSNQPLQPTVNPKPSALKQGPSRKEHP